MWWRLRARASSERRGGEGLVMMVVVVVVVGDGGGKDDGMAFGCWRYRTARAGKACMIACVTGRRWYTTIDLLSNI